MACPPQSCCLCPGGEAAHPGGPRAHQETVGGPIQGQGLSVKKIKKMIKLFRHRNQPWSGFLSPVAASTPRRSPTRGNNGPIMEETAGEINDLESLGILRRSQMGFDISQTAENDVDQLDFSQSQTLDVVPHVEVEESAGLMNSSYMERGMMGAEQGLDISPCVCAPRGSPGPHSEGQQSMGLMDSARMERYMIGAGYSGAEIDNSFGILPQGYMDREMMGAGYDQTADFHASAFFGAPDDTTPPDHEISQALDEESHMTVYDPEDLNMTMAPRTNNLETRRQVLYATFTREYDATEDDENEAAQELLEEFRERRRNEVSRSSEESN